MASSDLGSATFDDVQRDVFQQICRLCGVKNMHISKRACSKLHRAWQAAIVALNACSAPITDQDITIMSNYVSLERLSIAAPVPNFQGLFASLFKLTTVSIIDSGSLDAVLGLARIPDACTRIQNLTVSDASSPVNSEWVAAMAALKALRSLNITCMDVIGSANSISDSCESFSELQELELATASTPQPGILQAFPGSLSSLTALKLNSAGNHIEQPSSISAAVAALTNLRSFNTNYIVPSEAEQRQAFARLSQLTKLRFGLETYDEIRFVALEFLPHLAELTCKDCDLPAQAVVTHQHITRIAARSISCPDAWRGRTAQLCPLQQLELRNPAEPDLQNLPSLPRLTHFLAGNFAYEEGDRYLHMARLLRRQAGTLEQFELYGSGPAFEEAWPEELPACRDINLTFASRYTLQLLSACRLPALRGLSLYSVGPVVPEADFAWLGGLPSLACVMLPRGLPEEHWQEVRALFDTAGRGVVLERCW
jgi:hypothetical protein